MNLGLEPERPSVMSKDSSPGQLREPQGGEIVN